jgi:hypothetical protein
MPRSPEIPTYSRVTVSISESDALWLEATALRLGQSQSKIVRRALSAWRTAERRNLEPHDYEG